MPDSSNFTTFDNRGKFTFGRRHLAILLGDKLVRYAYIRKNGCSAFKYAMGYDPATRLSELSADHKCRLFDKFDATIFVWRDPEERLLSLYRNKIVDGSNNFEIVRRFKRFARGRIPNFGLFAEFAARGRDPHCLPQAAHLKPLLYTHAIPLDRLHAAMIDLAGADAARPFRRPVNISSRVPIMVSDRAHEIIRSHYAADYALIARLTAPADPAKGGA